ncbi:MAG TPA: DUF4349 domain-containing protein [Flavobacterium sp.]|nr:DUF4349 domain-containing protein [Flavobacterium sp.]
MQKTILLLCLIVLFVSCKREESAGYEKTEVLGMALPESEVSATDADYSPNESTENTAQKIIKNGKLQFETSDLDKTAHQIYDAVKKYNGQIQSDREEKSYGSIYRNITIRVSNKDFENLVQDVSAGVGYFDQKDISSEDVTERFIDIEARLKAKKELENRYLELLKKANKISEILEIEKELVIIREEIESRQGQLNYLKNRVAMSTLEVRFYKQTSETGVTVSYGSKMWHSVKSGFELISSFFLGVLYVWPLLLISGLIFYIFRKRRKRQNNK